MHTRSVIAFRGKRESGLGKCKEITVLFIKFHSSPKQKIN